MLRLQQTRVRRQEENAYRKRRKQVEDLYGRLKYSGDLDIVPPLPEFRALPMVQRIQYKIGHEPPSEVARELRDSKLAIQLVKEDNTQWTNVAKKALGEILGFESWSTSRASTTELHPVDRLTARFRCKKCDIHNASSSRNELSLDFSGACQHVCRRKGKGQSKKRWEADNFVPDRTVSTMEVFRICWSSGSLLPRIGHRRRRASTPMVRLRCR